MTPTPTHRPAPRTGSGSDAGGDEDLRERYLLAALQIMATGTDPAALTVRRVAEIAGTSTMGVYTQFGGRPGILCALYDRAISMLGRVLEAAPGAPDPRVDLENLAGAHRDFATQSAVRYVFLFGRPLPDFTPSPETRQLALDTAHGAYRARIVRGEIAQGEAADRAAHQLFCAVHGTVDLELNGPPGDGADPATDVRDIVRVLLAGFAGS